MARDIDSISFGSVSLIRQGDHRFFSLTLPSETLAATCFVTTREEDPLAGFQRVLDEKRAREIAAYIDSGLGTIPNSIVLSAQEEAELTYDSRKKSLAFNMIPKAFLIIDGQHRVFGFTKAKTSLRVPVIIYSDLTKKDETRLFIDINSKQKGVPPELLLDIKKQADYETDQESLLRQIFDSFHTEPKSALFGKLSPSSKQKGKITRSVFNTSVKPLVRLFGDKDDYEIFDILNSYLNSFIETVLERNQCDEYLTQANVFKAITGLFPSVASRVKNRYGALYTVDNFSEFLRNVGSSVKVTKIKETSYAYKPLLEHFEDCLETNFTL